MKGKTPFGALFREYARRKLVDVSALRFVYVSRHLRHDETPKSIKFLPDDLPIQVVFLGIDAPRR